MSRRVNGGQFQEVGITNPHRPPINTTIRPLETSVSLYAPYGCEYCILGNPYITLNMPITELYDLGMYDLGKANKNFTMYSYAGMLG